MSIKHTAAPEASRQTSPRHTQILNGYRDGTTPFRAWAERELGDLAVRDWSWGSVHVHWKIDDRFIMPDGVMFGGHIAAVGDHMVGLGALSVLTKNNERFRTSRLETNYFRPLTKPYADIHIRVTNASKTLIHVEADFINAEEKLAVRVYAVQVRRAVTEQQVMPGEE